jgi:hypothetical protein
MTSADKEAEKKIEQANSDDRVRDNSERIKNGNIHEIGWIYPTIMSCAAAYLGAVSIVLLADLLCVWPASASTTSVEGPQIVLLAALAGGLGGAVYTDYSFVSHLGTGTSESSWVMWYYVQPLVGLLLGVVVYFVIRGGLLVLTVTQTDLNVYGIVAIGALAGVSSKQMMATLKTALDGAFGVKGDGQTGVKGKTAEPAAPSADTSQGKTELASLALKNEDYPSVYNNLNSALELLLRENLSISQVIPTVNSSDVIKAFEAKKIEPYSLLSKAETSISGLGEKVKKDGKPTRADCVAALLAMDDLESQLKKSPIALSKAQRDEILKVI